MNYRWSYLVAWIMTYTQLLQKMLGPICLLHLGCLQHWAINSTLQSKYSLGEGAPESKGSAFNYPLDIHARCSHLGAWGNSRDLTDFPPCHYMTQVCFTVGTHVQIKTYMQLFPKMLGPVYISLTGCLTYQAINSKLQSMYILERKAPLDQGINF